MAYDQEATRKMLAARRLSKPGDVRHNSQAEQQQQSLDSQIAELTLQQCRLIDAAKRMDAKLPLVDAFVQELLDGGAIVGCDLKIQHFGTNDKNRRNIHTDYKLVLDVKLSDEAVDEIVARAKAKLSPLFTEVKMWKNWYEGYEKHYTKEGKFLGDYYFSLCVYDDVPQVKR